MMVSMLKASHSAALSPTNAAREENWDQRQDSSSCFQMSHHLLYFRDKEGLTGDGHVEKCACACGQLQ